MGDTSCPYTMGEETMMVPYSVCRTSPFISAVSALVAAATSAAALSSENSGGAVRM